MPSFSLHTALLLSGLLGWVAFRLSREPPGIEYLQIFRWREAETYWLGTWIHENLPDTVLIAVPPTSDGKKFSFSLGVVLIFGWVRFFTQTSLHSPPSKYGSFTVQTQGMDVQLGRP